GMVEGTSSVRRHGLDGRQVEAAVRGRQHTHRVAVVEVAGDDAPGQRRLDALADHALQRTRAEHRVVAAEGELLHGLRRHLERYVPLVEATLQATELDARD